MALWVICVVFFFNDTATTEIYTLSLHDALPISLYRIRGMHFANTLRSFEKSSLVQTVMSFGKSVSCALPHPTIRFHISISDRKSTRLNSSHLVISYAVFCLKKKNKHCTQFMRIS